MICVATCRVKNIRDEQVIRAIGERVRSLRTERKLSMEKLAQLAEMEYRQLSNVELGQTDASISTLSAICGALGISLKELMDGEGLM